jgi:hypothetical protein
MGPIMPQSVFDLVNDCNDYDRYNNENLSVKETAENSCNMNTARLIDWYLWWSGLE